MLSSTTTASSSIHLYTLFAAFFFTSTMIVSKPLFSALLASAMAVYVAALPQGGSGSGSAPSSSSASGSSPSSGSSSGSSSSSSAPGGSQSGSGSASSAPIPAPSGAPLPPSQAQLNVTALASNNGQPALECWNIKDVQGALTDNGPVAIYTFDADGNSSFGIFPPGFSTQEQAAKP